MASIRQLKSGRWQARVYVDGKYKSIGTFATHKEAEIKANKEEENIYYGRGFIDRNITMKTVIDDWFNEKIGNVKRSTLDSIERTKRVHIEPFFSNKKIFTIRRKDVVEWTHKYRDLKDDEGNPKYAYNTRLDMLATLKDIFNHAVYKMEILTRSPAGKVYIKRLETDLKKQIKYYSLFEMETLLDSLKNYEPKNYRFRKYKLYYVLFYLLSRTGLRIGEALALTWGDFDGKRIDINKQVVIDDKGNLSITSPKTAASYRSILLDNETIKLLKQFRTTQNEMIINNRHFHRHKNMAIFQKHDGTYMRFKTVRETLKRYCELFGVEYKALHAFRHGHAVASLEGGASLLYISRRLGHGTIQTTADTYLDITDNIESDEISKIANIFNSDLA